MLPSFEFHHIGVVVADIDATAAHYVRAGYEKSESVFDPIQNVSLCFLRKAGMPTVELIFPVDETSPAARILKKVGVSPYHCCYLVKDIDAAVRELEAMDYVAKFAPVEACALENRKITFLYNRDVGLIELLEKHAQTNAS